MDVIFLVGLQTGDVCQAQVVIQWKQLVLQNDNYSEPQLDNLITGDGTPETSGKMCRKCFASYERLADLTTTIRSNLSKFIDATTNSAAAEDALNPAKRFRYSAPAGTSLPKASIKLSEIDHVHKCSPPVVVSHIYKLY